MPLHPAYQHYAIALVRIPIHKSFDAFGSAAQRHDFERTDDRAAHRGFDNSVMRQHVGLAFGRCRAMTAHGWKDKRMSASRLVEVDYGANNGCNVRNAAATDTDGHPRTRTQTCR